MLLFALTISIAHYWEPMLETVTAKDGAAATENALTSSHKR
ncbi:MAG TPA: hypothetical protein VE619_03970 [Nitrososphaeraceae archaeon]|nr:hypothetical protein [Nitrososphaeraceae archaeon]